ncbi:MAG: hypothetical protein Unbinned15contig1001_36 [Prokaryotic dsDNA virus sp.]|nr:MAG: hypothetical protein Unbinned15contig1001_36 [Prokaryotic dsDNA virus sp.]|tara:strand:+ start:11166 stop:11969 length:804 start_codon:yes stop_codon:yes gene_type:complete
MLNLRLGNITTHFNIPKFIGSMDAGRQHSGSQPAVGLNCNGIFELQHSAHGLSGYYDNYWWQIYPWVGLDTFKSKLLRKTSDNTWVIYSTAGVAYTNPAKSSTPPQTGWVTTGGNGIAPVPQLGFKTIITEQDLNTTSNCSETARTTNSVTLTSSSSSNHKVFTFGDNTLSDGDKFAVGYKRATTGITSTTSFTIAFGGVTPVMTGALGFAGNSSILGHSFDQTVGSKASGITASTDASGLNFTTSGTSQFPDTSTITFTDLRVMAL